MEEIKNKLRNTKIQCSGATDEIRELFKKLDMKLPKGDFLFIDNDLNVSAVEPQIYKHLEVPEISPVGLSECIEEYEKESIVYKGGTVVTAEIDGYDVPGVVLEDRGTKVLALGLTSGGYLYSDAQKWSKSLLRESTAEEFDALTAELKENGYRISLEDGRINIFYLRKFNQFYYTIDYRPSEDKLVQKQVDTHTDYDTYCYEHGNYFQSEKEALDSIKEFLRTSKNS